MPTQLIGGGPAATPAKRRLIRQVRTADGQVRWVYKTSMSPGTTPTLMRKGEQKTLRSIQRVSGNGKDAERIGTQMGNFVDMNWMERLSWDSCARTIPVRIVQRAIISSNKGTYSTKAAPTTSAIIEKKERKKREYKRRTTEPGLDGGSRVCGHCGGLNRSHTPTCPIALAHYSCAACGKVLSSKASYQRHTIIRRRCPAQEPLIAMWCLFCAKFIKDDTTATDHYSREHGMHVIRQTHEAGVTLEQVVDKFKRDQATMGYRISGLPYIKTPDESARASHVRTWRCAKSQKETPRRRPPPVVRISRKTGLPWKSKQYTKQPLRQGISCPCFLRSRTLPNGRIITEYCGSHSHAGDTEWMPMDSDVELRIAVLLESGMRNTHICKQLIAEGVKYGKVNRRNVTAHDITNVSRRMERVFAEAANAQHQQEQQNVQVEVVQVKTQNQVKQQPLSEVQLATASIEARVVQDDDDLVEDHHTQQEEHVEEEPVVEEEEESWPTIPSEPATQFVSPPSTSAVTVSPIKREPFVFVRPPDDQGGSSEMYEAFDDDEEGGEVTSRRKENSPVKKKQKVMIKREHGSLRKTMLVNDIQDTMKQIVDGSDKYDEDGLASLLLLIKSGVENFKIVPKQPSKKPKYKKGAQRATMQKKRNKGESFGVRR